MPNAFMIVCFYKCHSPKYTFMQFMYDFRLIILKSYNQLYLLRILSVNFMGSCSAISHFLLLIHQFSLCTMYCGFHLLPRLCRVSTNKNNDPAWLGIPYAIIFQRSWTLTCLFYKIYPWITLKLLHELICWWRCFQDCLIMISLLRTIW